MARYLLDTDAVIDYLAGVPRSVALIRDLHERGDILCVSDVVVAEVHSGLKAGERQAVDAFLFACAFLSTGIDDACQAGDWRYDYARKGVSLSTSDVLIAATARGHSATVVTGNVDDYPMSEIAVLPLPRA